ncbi:hypothetical protein [Bacteroides ilei]|uniref:hypothetical protein n=1 Tax=Bacteroides ilei TaxID=1907658 RepID=UPI003AB68F63
MRKKYLSALLFGALLFASAGTFTSCKDYDDDINNLQAQITANAQGIEELKSLVENGDYVTNVEKSADGLVITFKNAGTQTITLEDKVGSVVTVNEDGVLCIDGEPTEIKVATSTGEESKDQIIIENNMWSVLQEDGTYKSTNIPVSGVSVSGSAAEGYTFTIYENGKEPQTVKLPSAASLITSIDLKDLNLKNRVIKLEHSTFTKPGSEWKGKATLPSTGTEIYVGGQIDVRVNPVDAPVTDAEFTLINPKNTTLSHVVMTAASSDINGTTIGDMAGRAVYEGNGLYTLSVKSFTLTKDEQNNINWESKGVSTEEITDINTASAWAINANSEARSAYGIAVSATEAEELKTIEIKDVENSNATLAGEEEDATAKDVTLKVGQSYKIQGIVDKDKDLDEDQYLYDVWFEFSDKDKEVFGIEYDDLNRTFKITNNPESVTTKVTIPVTVHTLDIGGNIKEAIYNITLSPEVSSNIAYDAVTFNIANLLDLDYNNNAFVLSIDKFKEANTADWDKIIYGASLSNITYTIYTKADCSDKGTTINVNLDGDDKAQGSLIASYGKSDGKEATEVSNLQNIVLTVDTDNKNGLSLDKQYYLKVSFNNNDKETISSFVVPVTFTAPSVADLFVPKEGFVDADGNVVMYYDKNTDNKPQQVKSFFTSTDAAATLEFDTNTVFTLNGTKFTSEDLAEFVENANGDEEKNATSESYIKLISKSNDDWQDGTGRELGYGQVLTVKATAATDDKDAYVFNGTGWKYAEKSDKVSTKFTVKVMSPIYEGQISYEGDAISVKANNEGGALITADMVWLTDYNKNKYTIVPNQNAGKTAGAIVDQNETDDFWSAAQIDKVVIDASNSDYISTVQYRLPKAATETTPAVEGAFVITARGVVKTVTDHVNIKVTDRWGYTKTFTNVPIQIVVE